MNVLLSIKPEFAFKIFDGTKKYEFRKSIFKKPGVKKVIVYASSPVQQVIGEFEIERVLSHDVETLWEMSKEHGGISEDFYFEYFSEKEVAYAIEVKNYEKYQVPLSIERDFAVSPPQSYRYVANSGKA